jgi:hypothetical protein
MYATIPDAPLELPETAFSLQCRTVAVMYGFFITTVIPRATATISAAKEAELADREELLLGRPGTRGLLST